MLRGKKEKAQKMRGKAFQRRIRKVSKKGKEKSQARHTKVKGIQKQELKTSMKSQVTPNGQGEATM